MLRVDKSGLQSELRFMGMPCTTEITGSLILDLSSPESITGRKLGSRLPLQIQLAFPGKKF